MWPCMTDVIKTNKQTATTKTMATLILRSNNRLSLWGHTLARICTNPAGYATFFIMKKYGSRESQMVRVRSPQGVQLIAFINLWPRSDLPATWPPCLLAFDRSVVCDRSNAAHTETSIHVRSFSFYFSSSHPFPSWKFFLKFFFGRFMIFFPW